MTREVVWSDEAFSSAQRYLVDDRQGLTRVFETVDLLSDDPRPIGAYACGGDRFRLRIGRYRVIYEVREESVTIEVIHLGRT